MTKGFYAVGLIVLAFACAVFIFERIDSAHFRTTKINREDSLSWIEFHTGQLVLSFITYLRQVCTPAEFYMWELSTKFVESQVLYVAAKLNIAEHMILADGTKISISAEQLASKTSVQNYDFFLRILRYLEALAILYKNEKGEYSLTRSGELLWDKHPLSFRASVITNNEEHFLAFSKLHESLFETEKNAFQLKYPNYKDVWDYFGKNPEASRWFDSYMHSISQRVSELTIESFPYFPQFESVLDVGGGQGLLIFDVIQTSIEKNNSFVDIERKYGIFDLSQVVDSDHAKAFLAGKRNQLQAICENKFNKRDCDEHFMVDYYAGDFFDAVPSGYACYTLKLILHDWNDEESITILKNIRKAMTEASPNNNPRLLIIENVVEETTSTSVLRHAQLTIDAIMMVITNGKERTREEYERLLTASQFKIAAVHPTLSNFAIIEAIPA